MNKREIIEHAMQLSFEHDTDIVVAKVAGVWQLADTEDDARLAEFLLTWNEDWYLVRSDGVDASCYDDSLEGLGIPKS